MKTESVISMDGPMEAGKPSVMRSWPKRHSVITYYALVFGISWGGLLIAAALGGVVGTNPSVTGPLRSPFALAVMEAAPTVAGLLLIGLVYRGAGLRLFLSRLLRWRVGASWYAVALLTIPLTATPVLLLLSLTSPAYLSPLFTSRDKVDLVLTGIAAGLLGGFAEETGWTGFAAPELKPRYGFLGTGLLVGFLWGLWHIPITVWEVNASWTLFVGPLFFYAAVLPAYRVLMVWVYDRSESLLVVGLMHASLIASTLSALQPPVQGAPLVTYYIVLAAVLWVIVAAVARGHHVGRTLSAVIRQESKWRGNA